LHYASAPGQQEGCLLGLLRTLGYQGQLQGKNKAIIII